MIKLIIIFYDFINKFLNFFRKILHQILAEFFKIEFVLCFWLKIESVNAERAVEDKLYFVSSDGS